MGFKAPDLTEAYQQINRASMEMNSSFNDGFTSWRVKQDLYQLLFHLQNVMEKSPNFGNMEKEWLTSLHKNKMWQILNQ